MKITKYIHSCLLIEKDSDRILFDPGAFSFKEDGIKPSQFRDIQAIFITHKHPDHIDGDALKEILGNNENVPVYGNADTVEMLAEKGIEAEVFESGEMMVAGFSIQAFEAKHELILAAEIPKNTAYMIDGKILNPGDSYDKNLYGLKGTEILCLPTMAPWASEPLTYEFAREMSPKFVVPIHDGYAKDYFLQMRYRNFKEYFEKDGIEFQWLDKAGASFED